MPAPRGPRILNINCWNEWTEGSYLEFLSPLRGFGVSFPSVQGLTPNAAYFVAARREPSGITVGKPGGLRRSANKNAPKWFQSKWHWADAPGYNLSSLRDWRADGRILARMTSPDSSLLQIPIG